MATITTKLTLWYSLAAGFIITVASMTLYYSFDSYRRETIDEDLEHYAGILSSSVIRDASIQDAFGRMLSARNLVRTGYKGHFFAVTKGDSLLVERSNFTGSERLIEHVRQSQRGPNHADFSTFFHNGEEFRILIQDLPAGRPHTMHLIVVTSLARLRDSLAAIRTLLLTLVPLGLFAAAFTGWFVTRRALRPVRMITDTAASISSSSLDRRVPRGTTQDELSTLADTFNNMISRLDTTFKSQQRFIADASHDLRTPLTVVQMELELLMMGYKSEYDTREALQRCMIEVERLSQLASDLLFLARADAHQLTIEETEFRLDELLVECVSQLGSLTTARALSFDVRISHPAEILGDASLLRRAIMNVLGNAINYARRGTAIRTEVRVAERDISVRIINKLEEPIADLPERLFDRFHRGDSSRSTSGSGLGLAIVRAIMERHGGTAVAVIDEPGQPDTAIRIELRLPASRSVRHSLQLPRSV